MIKLSTIGPTILAILGAIGLVFASSEESLRPFTPVAGGVGIAGAIWAWRSNQLSLVWVLSIAVVLRIIVVWIGYGVYSDDVFRYQWDGELVVHGESPYYATPSELIEYESEFSELYPKLNSPDYYSVYPPVSQILFVFGNLFSMRMVFALCEIGALFLLAKLVSPRALIFYAWNPLVLLETWGQTHTESAMLVCLVAMLVFIQKRWFLASSAALTVAIWIKLWPVLLVPIVLRHQGWRIRDMGAMVAVSAVVWIPFTTIDITNILTSLKLYMHTFEFNAGLYYISKSIVSLLVYGLNWIPDQDVRPIIGVVSKIVLLSGLAVIFWRGRNWRIESQVFAVIVLSLLTLPTIHPWYLLPVLLLLPMFPQLQWSWIWLGICSLGTYLLYTHGQAWYWSYVGLGWTGWAVWVIRDFHRWKSAPESMQVGPSL